MDLVQGLKFADDTKRVLHINTLSEYSALQEYMLLLNLPGPEIPTWTSTSMNVFTCHANVSWTLHILYLTQVYHTLILIKILDSFYLRIYVGTNTIKPLPHMLTNCWANMSHYSLFSFNFHNG